MHKYKMQKSTCKRVKKVGVIYSDGPYKDWIWDGGEPNKLSVVRDFDISGAGTSRSAATMLVYLETNLNMTLHFLASWLMKQPYIRTRTVKVQANINFKLPPDVQIAQIIYIQHTQSDAHERTSVGIRKYTFDIVPKTSFIHSHGVM